MNIVVKIYRIKGNDMYNLRRLGGLDEFLVTHKIVLDWHQTFHQFCWTLEADKEIVQKFEKKMCAYNKFMLSTL
jgi:hypothetical protein